MDIDITIAIPTFNRRALIGRAIESVLAQSYEPKHVLVVDDCSTDGTLEFIQRRYPSVTCVRQAVNRGPGPCRNLALQVARSAWVYTLDSDDSLLSEALTMMASRILEFPQPNRYPVFFFASTHAYLPAAYVLLRPEHLLRSDVRGELRALIRREMFLQENYRYPDLRIGGEGLLWLEVAQRHGIPAWAARVTRVHYDAGDRLTNTANQIRRPREYAELQDLYLSRFGELMRTKAPGALLKRRLGAATYWLLAGDRRTARRRLEGAFAGGSTLFAAGIWMLSFLPRKIAVCVFRAFRTLELRKNASQELSLAQGK